MIFTYGQCERRGVYYIYSTVYYCTLAADLLRPCSRRLYEMQTNEIPTSAPGDRAPTSEEPAPIKMTNQQAELNQLEQPSCSLSLALS